MAGLAVLSHPLAAQQLDWRTRVVLYGDNTEFFTPYRVGETILGGQLSSWVAAKTNDQIELRVGLFADRRWGSNAFTDSVKPILSFRYHTDHSLGVFGTLETVRRHGLLEPLMVTTRELTTPIEYGAQWLEKRGSFHGEMWINWQRINTPTEREQFELGTVLHFDPVKRFSLDAQHLWYHRGGQLFTAGVSTSNNRTAAFGATLHDSLRGLGESSIGLWRLMSWGHIDPDYPSGRALHGHGTYIRGSITPHNWFELSVIRWLGHDFSGDDGDNNYSSTGVDPGYYRTDRTYTEIGFTRRLALAGGASFDAEWRFHQIDGLKSIAFFNSRWEISYRLVARAPIDILIRRDH